MKPIFIVLEGLDGSGTSTQADLVEKYFKDTVRPAIKTFEPSAGLIGSVIRLALKRRIGFQTDTIKFDRQMALLFAADRHDHLYNDVDGVVPTINAGISVICSRYIPSSYAYHCSNEAEWRFIENLNSEFPQPDLLIYLDNEVSNSLSRISERQVLDSYEQKDKLQQAYANYKRYISAYTGRLLRIDATLSKEIVFSQIVHEIENIFTGKIQEVST
jgi:dTMP kinase